MENNIIVPIEQVKRIYSLLEELVSFFHQPMHFENKEDILKFAKQYYPEMSELYYKVVWDWLPEKIQKEIQERE